MTVSPLVTAHSHILSDQPMCILLSRRSLTSEVEVVTSALESLIGCTIPFVATVDPPMHATEKLYKAVASDFSGFTLATMKRTLRNSLSRLHQQLCKHR
jgi:hypothetical protein